MIYYVLTFLIAVLALIYAFVVLFSHKPRLPEPTEGTYLTNGPTRNTNESFDLPPRITPESLFNYEGIDVSLIIPSYNEAKRITKMLDEAIAYLEETHSGKYEIIIVDDQSSDDTVKVVLDKADEFKLSPHVMRIIKLTKNRGKGGAVTHGLLHSRGRYSLFADADGATLFPDIKNLLAYLESTKGATIAIGSRAHMVNTDAVVKRSFIRNFLMYGLHTLVFIFGIRDVQDTQCGFKMFNFEAVRAIFPHMHTERWIFDVEVLLLGEIQGMNMKEIAVNWTEIDGSKVDLARDSIAMAVDLVVTRLAYLLGIYKLDQCGRGDTKKNQ
ncbi:Dolichyl-phosphate beta-glucosyltransferase [Candida viswanathii]|uniref:dolichyl-phosphate beta-glucosyltransferase n=1 Tax=Candida viswanathii TaxID=5486 RepID=A0A367XYZ4_9ASCO|nr:Dolichyl-phosphate beta-glucosyltransferase [Candida viswanathii]